MTAKHRKGKGNHKHEDNFFKNEVIESEVRAGGSNYTPLLVLFLMIVVGGAIGAWLCFQQHQTLTYLTDSVAGMQMKVVKLQSSHEEMRQSSGKQHLSEDLESRLNALEESNALAQKQVGIALATAEQLKTSDLPAQVLSLHTEMKTRLAEMQQATVSLEQLSELQTALRGKSDNFEEVEVQVGELAGLSAELSQEVEVLTRSLEKAESKLEERERQVATLSVSLVEQAAEMLRLREQLDSQQAQLKASTLEMAAVRELLEKELGSQRLQQVSVEKQLVSVHQSLQDQNSAAQNLRSDLTNQLENIRNQINQLVHEVQPPAESVGQTDEETAPTAQEEAAAASEEEEEEEEEEEALAVDVEKEAEIDEEDETVEEVDEPVELEEYAAPTEEVKVAKEEEEEEVMEDDDLLEEEAEEELDVKVDDEEESEGEEVQKESSDDQKSEEKEEAKAAEREETNEEQVEKEMASEVEEVPEEEEEAEEEEEERVVAADEGEEPLENDASPDNQCKC